MHAAMAARNVWLLIALVAFVGLAVAVGRAESMPASGPDPNYYKERMDEQSEDILMDLLARFGQTIMRARNDMENSKRTVDFGLARGFSGAQEAKHRLGLAAANFAGGPGRKRRSDATGWQTHTADVDGQLMQMMQQQQPDADE